MSGNNISHQKSPKGQRNFEVWECKVIRWAHENNISAEELTTLLNRDISSIYSKSMVQGFALKKKKL